MSAGTQQIVLICAPGAAAASPCPAGTGPAISNAYLLDTTAASWVEDYSAPFSFAQAGMIASASLSTVLLCWFIAYLVKQVVKAVR